MLVVTKVSYEKANAKLKALGQVLKRPLRDVLDSGARLAAISCAKESQPFGTGEEARQMGERAVARDIAKVYCPPGRAWEDITIQRWQRLFWKAYNAGELAEAQLILNHFGNNLKGVQITGEFDDGQAHRASRNATTGRVQLTRPVAVVSDTKALADYTQAEQDNVGFGKGGWADVARQLGSIRGLKDPDSDITANWITRKAAGLGNIARSGSDENPQIIITSHVHYADNILDASAKGDAIGIARHRMIENLEYAVKAETRKLRSAA